MECFATRFWQLDTHLCVLQENGGTPNFVTSPTKYAQVAFAHSISCINHQLATVSWKHQFKVVEENLTPVGPERYRNMS